MRLNLTSLGGVILTSGMRTGVVVVPAERVSLRVTDGRVVTNVEATTRGRGHVHRAA